MPSDAPALVLAVPGAACDASDDLSAKIVGHASGSCRGVVVRAGYLEGDKASLTAALAALRGLGAAPAAVVVPLLTGPHPSADAALAKAITAAGVPVVVTGPLGPHPLLGEALHTRLAEAGLAHAGRMREISVAAVGVGVIVAAAGGAVTGASAPSASALTGIQEAGIVAVLLAARLAAPVVPAVLGNVASLRYAVGRLREAGVTTLALAPCVIGPECTNGELAVAAAEIGGRCAQPLGAHPAVGRLVAIRYGAALQDPRIARSVGRT